MPASVLPCASGRLLGGGRLRCRGRCILSPGERSVLSVGSSAGATSPRLRDLFDVSMSWGAKRRGCAVGFWFDRGADTAN